MFFMFVFSGIILTVCALLLIRIMALCAEGAGKRPGYLRKDGRDEKFKKSALGMKNILTGGEWEI